MVAGGAWHQCSIEQTYADLDTRREGLRADEVASRRSQYGANVLIEAPPRSKLVILAGGGLYPVSRAVAGHRRVSGK